MRPQYRKNRFMPDHDLVALWEAHCRYEFETRDVDATMATLVAEPYVNQVPTMTGGVGHNQLKATERRHFAAAWRSKTRPLLKLTFSEL
jgi:carboxymethylenebutenolidase